MFVFMSKSIEENRCAGLALLVDFVKDQFGITEAKTVFQFHLDHSTLIGNKGIHHRGCMIKRDDSYIIQIALGDRNITQVAETIIHELTHVKQVEAGHDVTGTSVPYEDRWWEKEAREMEDEMLQKYISHLGKINVN